MPRRPTPRQIATNRYRRSMYKASRIVETEASGGGGGGSTGGPEAGDGLLLESGDYALLESGDFLLLE